jgi:Lrp/AsnC family transcriptional regulator for asnA, asnC and gidA
MSESTSDYQIDSTDRAILGALMADARRPYLEIARDIGVSGGTVHLRVRKLQEAGILRGTRAVVDFGRLGAELVAFIGITLGRAGKVAETLARLEELPQITQAHYTTGSYSLLIQVRVGSIGALREFLAEELQSIPSIAATETFMVLDSPIDRDADLAELCTG